MSNPRVTRDSSSLMIYDFLGPVWVVRTTRHPGEQFIDDL
jgi:hypothetical protein